VVVHRLGQTAPLDEVDEVGLGRRVGAGGHIGKRCAHGRRTLLRSGCQFCRKLPDRAFAVLHGVGHDGADRP